MPPETGPTIADFLEAWELFRDATLSGTLAAALLGMLGVYVVLRRMVFLTATISQGAGLGVALAFYAQLHWAASPEKATPELGAALVTLVIVLLVARVSRRRSGRQDALLGLIWLVGAAGTLAVGTRIVAELYDIETLLFGSAVAVMPEDYTRIWRMTVPLLLLHAWWWRGFAAASFDPDGSAVRGIPVRLLDLVLLGSLALAISVTTRVLGALPAFAFSVLPAMAAVPLAPNLPIALALGALLGAGCGFAGYVAAFLWDLPVGASQTLVAAGLVVVVEAVSAGWRQRQRGI